MKRKRGRESERGGGGGDRTENGDAFAILRSVVRAYCVGGQRGRQNVKCGRIARWEREIEQKRGRGKKLNPRDFIRALPTATVSFWRAIPNESTSENQEFARIRPACNSNGSITTATVTVARTTMKHS